MKTQKSTKQRPKPFMTNAKEEEPSKSMIRFDYIILALSFFSGKLHSRYESSYVVIELFENGSVLIYDIKYDKHFKVNGHPLKPYLTLEPPTSADTVNLHLPQAHADVTTVSPSSHQ